MSKDHLAHWLLFNGRALLSRVLIVGGIVRIWEHRGAQFKFESFPIYNAECVVAVILLYFLNTLNPKFSGNIS